MKRNIFFSVLVALSLLAGCAKTDSDNIKTAAFYADYKVKTLSSNPSVANCSASFRVEAGGTFIDLGASDTVTCNGQSMSRSEILGIVTYSVNLTATVGAMYTLVLTRSGESPYSSSVTLPEAIAPTSPGNGSSFAKGSALSTSWAASSNSGDRMRVSTAQVNYPDMTCPNQTSLDTSAPETGTSSFSAAQMSLPANGIAGACAMKIIWERTRNGVMPSGLSGVIYGQQETNVTITLN